MKQLITVLFITIFTCSAIFGQSEEAIPKEPKQMIIETSDDNIMIGQIEKEDENTIWLKTENYGLIEIKRSNILSIKEMKKDQIIDGEFWFENPNATRNLYGPTGYGLRKGEGYYQNFYVLFNSVSYGFTDHFTMGISTVPFGTLIAGQVPFFAITPKFSFPIVEDKVNAGVGVLYSRTFGIDAGIGYGVLTLGDRNHNFTLGSGFGFFKDSDMGFFSSEEGFVFAKRPIVTLSGTTRLSKRISLVTENWFIPAGDQYIGMLSMNVRYMLKNVSLDLGIINNMEGMKAGFIGIPVVGAVIPFEINTKRKGK